LATFGAQVEALTGISISGSSNPTQTELSAFLVDGVKDVVNRMIEARPAELSKFTNTTNSTSYVDKIGTVLSVVREHDSITILRKCAAIDPGDRYDATDSDSLLYRSKTNPGFYEMDGAIYTVPAAGSGNNDIIVTQVHYDTGLVFGDTYGASNSSIVSFPTDYEHLVAKYAAVQSLKSKMSNNIISITAVPPDVPTLTSVTFSSVGNDVDASLPTYTTATVSAGGVFGASTSPVYTAPTTTITAETWLAEYPLAQADLATPLAAIVTNVDLANSVIDTVPVPPDVPSAPSFSYTNAEDDTSIDSEIGAITDLEGLVSAPTYTPPRVGGAEEELTTTITHDASADANKLDFSDWFEKVGDYIQDDEDVELAGAQLQKIGSYIGAYNAAMTNQLHEFNEANALYQAEIKEHLQVSANEVTRLTTVYNKASDINLQNAVRTYQTQVDEYTQKISRYSAEISEYQAELSAMSAQAQGYLNAAQGYISEISTRLSITQTKISEYQARAQDSLQEFNEDNAAFQANIQEAIQEIQVANQVNIAAAQGELQLNMDNENRSQQRQLQNSVNDMQAIVANNDDLMGKFSAETAEYQSEVGIEVQEKTTKMQQYKVLHDQLLLDYNSAFGAPGAEA